MDGSDNAIVSMHAGGIGNRSAILCHFRLYVTSSIASNNTLHLMHRTSYNASDVIFSHNYERVAHVNSDLEEIEQLSISTLKGLW